MRSKNQVREHIVNLNYLCATPEQYEEWRRAARLSPPPYDSWICTDCTPEYQAKMKAKGWCARPEIRFKRTQRDGIEGFVPSKHIRSGELF
jgi:hypothetical protein